MIGNERCWSWEKLLEYLWNNSFYFIFNLINFLFTCAWVSVLVSLFRTGSLSTVTNKVYVPLRSNLSLKLAVFFIFRCKVWNMTRSCSQFQGDWILIDDVTNNILSSDNKIKNILFVCFNYRTLWSYLWMLLKIFFF